MHDPLAAKALRKRWLKTIASGSDEALDKLQKLMLAMAPQQQQKIEVPDSLQAMRQLSDADLEQVVRQLEADLGIN